MHKGTMSVKKEVYFGQEYIVLDVQEEEGKAKAILSKESAVELAKGLLRMAWGCGFVILKDDEQAEIKHLKREIEQLKKEQARDNLEIERLEESYKNPTYSVFEQV